MCSFHGNGSKNDQTERDWRKDAGKMNGNLVSKWNIGTGFIGASIGAHVQSPQCISSEGCHKALGKGHL